MKILIAGDGKLGMTLTKQLSAEGHDITLIDSDSDVLSASMEACDVMAVHGNCASMVTLQQAEVEDADLLIAVTGTDEVNLLCCATAHGMNPALHTIARIRNPEYTEQVYLMRDAFGLSMTVNPEKYTAEEIERLLKYPGFLKRDSFARGRSQIVELRVERDSLLCDLTLLDLNRVLRCKVLVCAVLRGSEASIPDGSFILREGDRIFVTAPPDNLAALLKNLGIVTHKVRRVMLIGGSRVSYYLSQALERSGIHVQIVEKKPDKCHELSALLEKACVVQGDASNQGLLESEGIRDCDALVTLTGLDELNMILALYGKSVGVPQIITKLGRGDHAELLSTLPLGSVVSPRKLSCNRIVHYVRAMQNQKGAAASIHLIADGQVEAAEFRVDDTTLHCGEMLKTLRLRKNVLVASIIHGSKTEIPSGDSVFSVGDTIIVVSGDGVVLRKLNDIFAE